VYFLREEAKKDDADKKINPDKFITSRKLEEFAVDAIVQEYLEEGTPNNKGFVFDKSRINGFLKQSKVMITNLELVNNLNKAIPNDGSK
jgi:hypothetical protein